MKIESFAKINLGLEVGGIRPDGYHDILTLFQSIDLADSLEFFPAVGRHIELSGSDASILWDESNLIRRAAELLWSETGTGRGVRIKVQKAIPAAKGLGGGSSNAAMTLLGLNAVWGLGLTPKTLMELGGRLGADVPFFLEGGLCLGEDRGDNLTPLADLPVFHCLLAFPAVSIRTADIYKAWLPSLTSKGNPSKIKRFLECKDFSLLENQLEETIFRFYPQLEEYKRFFQRQGAESSLVSGTGSTVFGVFAEKEKALRGWEKLREKVPSILVETLPRTAYRKRLRAGA